MPQCYPCVLRRALCSAERVSDDEWLQQKVVDESMRFLRETEQRSVPAEMVGDLLRSVQEVLGSADPWREQRERWLSEMQEAESGMRSLVEGDQDPLGRALLVSARCNVFANEILQSKSIREDLRRLGIRQGDPCDQEFVHDDRERFETALSEAENLLFLHDTAPELPSDKVLIEQLHRQKPGISVCSVVNYQPLLLKACEPDARKVALEGEIGSKEVLYNRGGGLGLVPDDCSGTLREAIDGADVIVAKGASHYQTLSGRGLPVFSLLRAKCPVTAASQSCRIGDLLFIRID